MSTKNYQNQKKTKNKNKNKKTTKNQKKQGLLNKPYIR